MPVAQKVKDSISRSSFIREMFEAGNRLKSEFGPENVFDFSLGNPDIEPPAEFRRTLMELVSSQTPGAHAYMPNAGWPDVRAEVASYASKEYGMSLSAGDIVMTCGAGGALNVALKTVLDPGDEVIVIKPYFVEYNFYVDNHGGVTVPVESGPGFRLDPGKIEAAATEKTKAVIINSPNNPTGVVYPEEDLQSLYEVLNKIGSQNGRPVVLLSDEPYRKIVYDGLDVPTVMADYPYVIAMTSYSKDLSLPGERIGYLAVHPDFPEKSLLMDGLIMNNRILGFVNAPSLMQRAVGKLQGVCVDVNVYQRRRDIFSKGLQEAGYELTVPQGAFYLYPRTPIEDDVAFVKELQKENILAVPGTGFGGPGYIRLAYCVPDDVIERSLPGFKKAFERVS